MILSLTRNVVDVHGKHDCCNNSLQALRKQCQNFATALLDHTRSSGELGEIQWNIDSIFFAGYIYPFDTCNIRITYYRRMFLFAEILLNHDPAGPTFQVLVIKI